MALTFPRLLMDISVCNFCSVSGKTDILIKVLDFPGCMTDISVHLRMYYRPFYLRIFGFLVSTDITCMPWASSISGTLIILQDFGREKRLATAEWSISFVELVVLFRCLASVCSRAEWAVISVIQLNIIGVTLSCGQ